MLAKLGSETRGPSLGSGPRSAWPWSSDSSELLADRPPALNCCCAAAFGTCKSCRSERSPVRTALVNGALRYCHVSPLGNLFLFCNRFRRKGDTAVRQPLELGK